MPWRELYWHCNFFFDKVSHLKHPSDHWRGKNTESIFCKILTGPSFTWYLVYLGAAYKETNPHHRSPSSRRSVNILADENIVVQASTINAEQMVNDSGRGPASKVAPVYSPLLSGFWSLSAEKSRTFNMVGEPIDLCCRCFVRAFLSSSGVVGHGRLVLWKTGGRWPKTSVVEKMIRNKVEGNAMSTS